MTTEMNPRPRTTGFPLTLRMASIIVLIFAIGVSGYLSYLKQSGEGAVCIDSGKFDCGTVLNSSYSELSGIPIAWLGLATNLIVIALLLIEPHVEFMRNFGISLVFGVVIVPFVFSIYLIYVQAQLIKAYCPWCLTHEALIFVLFALSAWRLRNMFAAAEIVLSQADFDA